MTFEEKVMAERARQDFVKVRPRAGIGAVNIVCGSFALKLAAGEETEVTRAEWLELYQQRGCLELVASDLARNVDDTQKVEGLKVERLKERSS